MVRSTRVWRKGRERSLLAPYMSVTFVGKGGLKSVTAIGLHGQTLWHEPDGKFPFSLQLGDANIVAVKTGIDVVCDFRSKDIALGGSASNA